MSILLGVLLFFYLQRHPLAIDKAPLGKKILVAAVLFGLLMLIGLLFS